MRLMFYWIVEYDFLLFFWSISEMFYYDLLTIICVCFFVFLTVCLCASLFIDAYKQYLQIRQIRNAQDTDKEVTKEKLKKELQTITGDCENCQHYTHPAGCDDTHFDCRFIISENKIDDILDKL